MCTVVKMRAQKIVLMRSMDQIRARNAFIKPQGPAGQSSGTLTRNFMIFADQAGVAEPPKSSMKTRMTRYGFCRILCLLSPLLVKFLTRVYPGIHLFPN